MNPRGATHNDRTPQAAARRRATTPIRPGLDRYALAAFASHREGPTRRQRLIAEPLLAFYWWLRDIPRCDASIDDLRFERAVWRFAGNRTMTRLVGLDLAARRHPSNTRPASPGDLALWLLIGGLCAFAVAYVAAQLVAAMVVR